MALEAPLSKYRRNNLLLYIAACLVAAMIFAYDGYLSQYEWSARHKFYEEHTDEQGRPDSTLASNRIAPPFLVAGALVLGGYWYMIRHRKLTAADNALVLPDGRKIPYAAIEQIDKTFFEKKGFFTIAYKHPDGRLTQQKLSDRQFDNLAPILDHLVAQIS
jgi:hypothetical protein